MATDGDFYRRRAVEARKSAAEAKYAWLRASWSVTAEHWEKLALSADRLQNGRDGGGTATFQGRRISL